ncbi:LysR family transcriptional regulator [Caulobacter sp. KR2-114]|uniref:LysR family transcriptional regulator n=1 Tax=Caulobacter sp. KR2-114 TaxID=3400912 RepID=UPI003C0B7BFA
MHSTSRQGDATDGPVFRPARAAAAVSDMDLRLLRVFMAVVENGGFAAAEVALNKSKSAISVDISGLEQRLGMRLCERGRAGFALTAEGETVRQAAMALFESLERFTADVSASANRLTGRVTLAVIDNIGSIAAEPMIAAIRAYRQRHPAVQLSIQSGSASEVERAVLDRTAQVGISVLPRVAPALEARELFVEDQLLYCGRAHPLFEARDAALTPEVIAQHPVTSFTLGDPAPRGLARGAQADNLDCLILVVLAGVDLGFLPPHYARRWAEAGELRLIRPDLYRRQSNFYLMSLKASNAAPVTRELIAVLGDAFAAHPVTDEAFLSCGLKQASEHRDLTGAHGPAVWQD